MILLMVTYRSTATRSTRRRQALKTKGERAHGKDADIKVPTNGNHIKSKALRSGDHAKSKAAPLPRRDSHFKINVDPTSTRTRPLATNTTT